MKSAVNFCFGTSPPSIQLLALLHTRRRLHGLHHGYEPTVTDDDLVAFMQEVLGRLGAAGFLTPRDVTRDFVTLLNLLRQNPGQTFLGLVEGPNFQPTISDPLAQARSEDELPTPGTTEFATFDL